VEVQARHSMALKCAQLFRARGTTPASLRRAKKSVDFPCLLDPEGSRFKYYKNA